MSRRAGGRGRARAPLAGTTVSAVLPTPAPPPSPAAVNFPLFEKYGGTTLLVTGTDLGSASTVAIVRSGVTTQCTNVASVGTSAISFVTPSVVAGTYDVVVTTAGGSATLTGVLEAWYYDQVTGVFNVTNADRGITASGSPAIVSALADQSGNANNMTTPTNEEPTLVTAAYGTRRALLHNHSQEGRLAAKHTYASGFSHFCIMSTTSTTASLGDYNVARVIAANYPSPAFNTWGMSSGHLDYVQFDGASFIHDEKTTLVATGLPKLIGITHNQGTNEVKQYIGATQEGSTVTRGYSGSDGIYSLGNSDGSGHIGNIYKFVTATGVIPAGDIAKINQCYQSTFQPLGGVAQAYNLIAWGDSITAGYNAVTPGVTSNSVAYPAVAATTMGSRYGTPINRGVVGERINEMTSLFGVNGAANLRSDMPNIVTCMGGVNNVIDGTDATTILGYINAWATAVNNAFTALGSSFPNYLIWVEMTTMGVTYGAPAKAVLASVNATMRSGYLARGFNGSVAVSLDTQMGVDPRVQANFSDELHPNVLGHTRLAADLVTTLQGMGLT